MSEPARGGGLTAAALEFAKLSPLWSKRLQRREITKQAISEPYTLMVDVSHAVVENAHADWVSDVFAHCEKATTSPDPEVIECALLGLLENVQNIASHAETAADPDKFVPMLGPSSRRLWDGLNRLWFEVAEHPPSHGTPDVYRHVDHVEVRKHIQAMYRRLPDGRYVSVPTVLIWEVEHGRGPHWSQFLRNR
jgi:hypothetical protein